MVEQQLSDILDNLTTLRLRALRFAPKDESLRTGFRRLTHELEQVRQARPVPYSSYQQVSRWLAAFLDAEHGAALAQPERLDQYAPALQAAVQERRRLLASRTESAEAHTARVLAQCLDMLNRQSAGIPPDELPGKLARALKQHLESDDELRLELTELTGAMHAMLEQVSEMLAEVGDDTSELEQTAALLQQGLPEDPEAARTILKTAQQGILKAGSRIANAARSIKETVESQSETVRKLAEQLHRAEREAMHDALTGLANRRKLEQFLASLSEDTPVAFVLGDIDHFKRINDRYGHDAGDEVLASVAQLLADGVRASDLVARMGGEEFAIVLVGVTGRHAFDIADSLRRAVAMADIKSRKGKISVTISMGVAVRRGNEAIKDWIRRADTALYEAKNGGRDQVKVATA